MLRTIAAAARALAQGKTSSSALVEEALARIAAPDGEGTRVFLKVHADRARAAADASDQLRAQGIVPSPLAGIPISVKDLFDVAGDVTTAGSRVLREAAPAAGDALAVARLRAAGAIIVGRTNMTEFAFSGIGINPHYGTPSNPWDRGTRRIPGGSSSGAAVSVADGMAIVGLGTDTGGSVRIPAALCGIVGFKPTARRVPLEGCFPLSTTLDSIGPLAPSVACCATVFQILAGEAPRAIQPAEPARLRLGVPTNVVLDDLEREVARAFEQALERISAAGTKLIERALSDFDAVTAVNRNGGISAPESYALHRRRLDRSSEMDPRVVERILRGEDWSAADYIELVAERTRLARRFNRGNHPDVDAWIMPTVPSVAPPIEMLERDIEAFRRANARMLRNTSLINFLDGCAVSLPMHRQGFAPAGLMVVGCCGEDERVLAIALALEGILQSERAAAAA